MDLLFKFSPPPLIEYESYICYFRESINKKLLMLKKML